MRTTSVPPAQSRNGTAPHEAEPMVFVVEDDEAVRNGLKRLLESASYHVEVFASAEEFMPRERYEGPACLLLDVYLPGLNGLDLQKALAAADYPLPIIFITGRGDVPMSVGAMKAGAADFLSKPFGDDRLIKALEDALAKSRKERSARAELALIKQRLSRLTPREYEVLNHVVAGKMNKNIAAELRISLKTVKVHRAQVMHKMKVESLAQLVRDVQQVGIPKRPGG